MGRPKQLLRLGNRLLLQHAVEEAAASRLDEIVLVLGHRAQEIREALPLPDRRAIRVVVNRDHALGQSTSLRLGLRSTDPRAVAAAILLGDHPQVGAPLIDRVAEIFLAGRSPLVRPVYSGPEGRRFPGHPVFLARRVWPELEGLSGDEGARVLLSARPDWLFEVPVEGEPPVDVDTWEDYRRVVDAARTAVVAGQGG